MINEFYKVTDEGELLGPHWWKKYVDEGLPRPKKR
jgi:hypothetical protein